MIMLFHLHLNTSLLCFHTTFVFHSMLWFGSTRHTSKLSVYAFMVSYFMFMHIGPSEEITLLEFNKEEEEDQQQTS